MFDSCDSNSPSVRFAVLHCLCHLPLELFDTCCQTTHLGLQGVTSVILGTDLGITDEAKQEIISNPSRRHTP